MPTEGVPVAVLVLVGCAAVFHAGWNAVARQVKGNASVLFVGIVAGAAMLAPASARARTRGAAALE